MYVKSAQLTVSLPYVSSLKEKRQIARSVIEKSRNKFNASVAEVAAHDSHNTLIIGISLVDSSSAHGQKCLDEVIRFVEDYIEINGHGEVIEIADYE